MSTPTPATPPADATTTDSTTSGSTTTAVDPRIQRLNNFTRVSSPIMSFLALVYLFMYTAQAMFYHPQDTWYHVATWFGNFLWLVFALDLAWRFILTPVKRHFFRHNWLDTITVLVPQFRALRTLQAFNKDSIITPKGKGVISSGAITTAVLGTFIVVWVGSIMVLSVERNAANATITSFPDALWWVFETVTTVGYGDFTPVTWAGRFYAVLIMFLGISVVGVVSASLAATLVKQNPQPATPAQEVLDELAELKQMVARIEGQLGGGSTTPTPASQ